LSSLSVIEPIAVAIQHTRRLLFAPFDLRKWLRLGFCAFLMGAGPGGVFGGGGPGTSSGPGSDFNLEEAMSWFQEHGAIILTVTLSVLVLLALLVVLFTWLSSRGRFMLLDGVIRNRGSIVEPWHAFRREGNSLFRFRVALGLISLVVVGLILGLAVLISLPDWRSGVFATHAIAAALSAALLLLIWILVMEVIRVLLLDVVAPVMWLHRLPVLKAWKQVLRPLWQEHLGSLALYLLMRAVLGMAVGLLTLLTIVFSCCLALIPYVGSVLLLPLIVFELTYPLAFLEQLGPDWQFFPSDRPPLPAA
jgi:hypothetical protein